MNKTAEWPFVKPEAGGAIEAPEARTARRADAELVEWILVDERSITTSAEVIGLELRGSGKTFSAHRDTGPLVERSLADAAIVGEKERKKSVRDGPDC